MGFISGSCSLVIRGEYLNNIDIAEELGISPTNLTLKGQYINNTKYKAPKDVWTYEVKLEDKDTPNTVVNNLVLKLKSAKKHLNHTLFEDISIRLYLQSDMAQMYFEILPSVLVELAELNIRFEVSILSWGGVEDK